MYLAWEPVSIVNPSNGLTIADIFFEWLMREPCKESISVILSLGILSKPLGL